MPLPRNLLSPVLLLFLSAPVPKGYAATGSACLGGGAPGTITITEKKLESSQASVAKELKAEQRCALAKPAESENWKVYFVAHLNRAPGDSAVNIVFYEQAPAKPGQPREPINAYPIHTKKDAKIMMSDIEIRPEDGFKPGGKYDVRITRLIGGKEEIYARTTLELK